MYIYHLPYPERKELCYILDQNNKWEELGKIHMQYDMITIDDIRKEIQRGYSPSNELLTIWGHLNHTVLELFMLLYRMKQNQAMTVIKKFIDEKYHGLIKYGEKSLDGLVVLNKKQGNRADSKIQGENFNRESKKILNIPDVAFEAPVVTRENNESSVDPPLLLLHPLGTSKVPSITESAVAMPVIPYEELQKSTNDWDNNAVLGKGGFATVYKGIWKCTQVAIKRLEQKVDKPENRSEQIKQSITELHCLNAYRHDNILPLYGYSIGGPHPCLIYQYMAGGSLAHRLRIRDPRKVLSWPTRLNIAIGTARGLQFLHTNLINGKPLVHGDIKSANILLDSGDQPRIGDFGLAREGPEGQFNYIKVSRIHGTKPYLPDEFLRGKKLSTKVDTYSFGVVLFEIATSLAAYLERREDKFLKDHVVNYEGNIMDLKDQQAEGHDECFKGLVEIGKMCVGKKAEDRPEMVSVLILLEKASPTNEE